MRFTLPILFIGVLMLGNCGRSDGERRTKAQDTRPPEEILYNRYCKGCHGRDGALMLGGASDLRISELSDEDVIKTISEGRGAMAAYNEMLTEEQIGMLAEYVKALRKN